MTRILIPILAVAAAGCVVENDPTETDLHDIYDEIDELDGDEGSESGENAPSLAVEFWPSQCEQGEDFIGYITVVDGDPAGLAVTDLVVYGDLEVTAWDMRNGEIVISARVPPDAVEGEVDIVIELKDGTALWIESATTVYEAGSGNSADSAGDPPETAGERETDSDSSDSGDCD